MGQVADSLRQVPLILPAWRALNRLPWLRRLREDWAIWRLYGRLRPTHLLLPGTQHRMYVDPRENRGRAILRCRAEGQPGLKTLWHQANAQLQPTLVLDVGLNYGEFVLAESYAPETRILGIEANPELMSWLERSRHDHPNGRQMEFYHALAADKTEGARSFFINRRWSGSSSAVQPDRDAQVNECQIPTLAVDDLVADRNLSQDTLLFKIDVEGYEPMVMAGMRQLLQNCPRWLGLLEFNTAFFQRMGWDVGDYLRSLVDRSRVSIVDHAGQVQSLTPELVAAWSERSGTDPEVCVDLLVVSPLVEFLPAGTTRPGR